MSKPTRSWFERVNPMGWADAADRRFVGLVRRLADLTRIGRDGSGRAGCGRASCEHGGACEARATADNEMTERLTHEMLKELFDSDPRRRKSAAKWFRERRIDHARAALEGSLAVEEDAGVRRELIKTLRGMEAERGADHGGM